MNERMPRKRLVIEESTDFSEADTLVRARELQKGVQKMPTAELQRRLTEIDSEEGTLVRNVHFGNVNQESDSTIVQKFENAQKIREELGREISVTEIIQNIPEDFDAGVLSENTRIYLKNAYPNTQYWDPRLITALDECGIHMDPERTIKPRILVTLVVNHEKRYVTLNIEEAVTVLLAYVHAGEHFKEKQYK